MASGRWEVTNREKRGLEMGNGKALGGAHPERGACEGAVGDQVTCLEVGGAFPRTILSCGTCGKEREEGSERLERCPCGRGDRQAWTRLPPSGTSLLFLLARDSRAVLCRALRPLCL
ncbi:hypothetical protein VULLAG_LOCUS11146 [Vulpes lagopus]